MRKSDSWPRACGGIPPPIVGLQNWVALSAGMVVTSIKENRLETSIILPNELRISNVFCGILCWCAFKLQCTFKNR